MKISGKESEKAILIELGKRIKQYRIASELTQAELAEKCGISSSTETRIESGIDSKMSNYIKILYGLKILENLDAVIPEAQPNLKLLFENSVPKQRVKSKKKKITTDWVWGEDK